MCTKLVKKKNFAKSCPEGKKVRKQQSINIEVRAGGTSRNSNFCFETTNHSGKKYTDKNLKNKNLIDKNKKNTKFDRQCLQINLYLHSIVYLPRPRKSVLVIPEIPTPSKDAPEKSGSGLNVFNCLFYPSIFGPMCLFLRLQISHFRHKYSGQKSFCIFLRI